MRSCRLRRRSWIEPGRRGGGVRPGPEPDGVARSARTAARAVPWRPSCGIDAGRTIGDVPSGFPARPGIGARRSRREYWSDGDAHPTGDAPGSRAPARRRQDRRGRVHRTRRAPRARPEPAARRVRRVLAGGRPRHRRLRRRVGAHGHAGVAGAGAAARARRRAGGRARRRRARRACSSPARSGSGSATRSCGRSPPPRSGSRCCGCGRAATTNPSSRCRGPRSNACRPRSRRPSSCSSARGGARGSASRPAALLMAGGIVVLLATLGIVVRAARRRLGRGRHGHRPAARDRSRADAADGARSCRSAATASAPTSAPTWPRTCTTRCCRRSRSCSGAPTIRARSCASPGCRNASCATGCSAARDPDRRREPNGENGHASFGAALEDAAARRRSGVRRPDRGGARARLPDRPASSRCCSRPGRAC